MRVLLGNHLKFFGRFKQYFIIKKEEIEYFLIFCDGIMVFFISLQLINVITFHLINSCNFNIEICRFILWKNLVGLWTIKRF